MLQFYPCAKTKNSVLLKPFVFFILFLLTQHLFAQPAISSFTPTSGPAGTSVTITGSNFNVIPGSDIVYFGAVKATVTAATPNTLTVTVPAGATYRPITVTVNGLTASSSRPFILTFNGPAQLNPSSFSKTDITGFNDQKSITAADLDGDGRPELLVTYYNSVDIYINAGTEGTLVYSKTLSLTTGTHAQGVSTGDVDGDGKADIVLANYDSKTLSVYRNTGSSGVISFAAPVNYTTGLYPAGTAIGDLNGDGKPEIVLTVAGTNSVWIYQNLGKPGTISFSPNIFLTADPNASDVVISDFDGDSQPDVVIGHSYGSYITWFRNTSASGNISFTTKADYALPGYPVSLCSGDIDQDGKPDLLVTNSNAASISVLRNTSTTGSISFAANVDYATGANPTSVIMSDLNGDNIPDIAVANKNQNTVSIFQNNSTPGVLSLASKIDFNTGYGPSKLCAVDLNQDGKTDLALTTGNYPANLSIFKNNGINEPVITSFTPTSGKAGTNVTIKGSGFTGATAVSFGGASAASFTVDSPTGITAVVGHGTAGTVAVTTPYGIGTAAGFTYVPTISSFAPLSGSIGTSVSIKGDGFSNMPVNNIVYFGAVRATVTAATTSSLTVIVPSGATYEPISVTVAGVTAYASQPFNVTFSGGGGNFTSSSFAPKTDLTAGYDPMSVAIGDLDADGKPDLAVAVRYTGSVSLYRNTSATGTISFAPKVDYTTASNTYSIALGDFNGDGKPDLVTTNSLALTVTVLKNNSTTGFFSFGSPQVVSGYYTGNQSWWVKVADLDADGKPDLVVGNYSPNNVTIFRNTSTLDSISFAMKIDYPVAASSKNISIGDLDGDGKPDMAVVTNGIVTLFKNSSTPGAISFAEAGNYSGTYGASAATIADFDGDGKPDLAITNSDQFTNPSNTVSVFKNTGSSGTISFGPKTDFAVGSGTGSAGFAAGDLNGDGKPDLTLVNSTYNISILKNTSINGTISFVAGNANYPTGVNPSGLALGDLDADGKSDIVEVNTNGNLSSVSVLRNTYKADQPVIASFTPASAQSGQQITITGRNFIPNTAVSFGKVPALSVTVTSDTTLTAITGAGASGYVRVSHEGGADSMSGFTFIPVSPAITSFTPTNAPKGAAVVIKGTHLAGTSAVYFGNTPVSSFTVTSDTTITAITGVGTSGYVRIKSPFGTDSLNGFTYIPVIPVISSFSPAAAKNGEVVTINGSYFTGVTGVSFGGVPVASIAVNSDSLITVITGPGASGDMIVTSADGADTAAGFIYTGTTVTSFKPAIAGKGSIVSIYGTNMRNANTVTFGGISATSFTVQNDTTIIATVGTGASGSVTVTTPQGTGTLPGLTFLQQPVITSFFPTMADIGDTITIKGKYFSYTDTVRFGGTAATWFKIVSDNTLQAVLPNGNTGDVTLTTAGGTATLAGFTFKSAPVIRSFTPASGPVGTTVTISGVRFGQTPADNIVFFGAVKATVLSSTGTSLTVKVPYGSTWQPISVTANGLTAYSDKPFIVTFNGGDTSFTANSFASEIDLTAASGVTDGAITDMYEDGKPDLVTGAGGGLISIFKNTGTSGTVSFDPKVDLSGQMGVTRMAISDLNGDGKQDISASASSDIRLAEIYKNITANGNVSFAPGILLTNQKLGWNYVASGDIDNDGKPDVAVLGFYAGEVSIFRNTSTKDSVSFDAPVGGLMINHGVGGSCSIFISDIDGDGKQDIIISWPYTISVFRNISSMGAIAFAPRIDLYIRSGTYSSSRVIAGDLDGDGKPDLVAAVATGSSLSVFRNTSVPGSLSFEARVDYSTDNLPSNVSIGDLNGDGKPEVIVSNGQLVSIFRNNSQPGTISLAQKVNYNVADAPQNVVIGDLDADGKPELVAFCANKVAVLKNQMNSLPAPVITSFSPDSASTGTTVTINGHHFTGTTQVNFGGTAAASYTVASDSVITATVGTGATGSVEVITPNGTGTLNGFVYTIPVTPPPPVPAPDITSFTPTSGNTGTIVTLNGHHFTGTTQVNFGGTAAASYTVASDSVITATVGTGATGSVEVITPNGTGTLNGFVYTIPVTPPPPVPAPDITSFTPTSGNTGTIVTINGHHFTGTTQVNFAGTAAASYTVISDSVISAIVGTGASGAVQVITSAGTDSLSGFTYIGNGQKITVAPNPASTFVVVYHPVSSGSAAIKLVDMMGNVIMVVAVGPNTSNTRIDLTGLKHGTYVISWSNGSDASSQLLLVQ